MDRHHRNVQRRRFQNRVRHGVGNVVKLQIQENFVTFADEIPDDGRTVGDKGLKSDFDQPAHTMEPVGKMQDLVT